MLGYKAAALSMAISRRKLHISTDKLIDITNTDNHAWIVKALARQGREIPDDISALFRATPLTVNGKSETKSDHEGGTEPTPDDNGGGKGKPQSADAQRHEHFKAVKMQADAEAARLRTAELRGELIKVNPFGKFLVGLVSAERTQVINSVPNISQHVLSEIKNALDLGKSDSEVMRIISEIWIGEIEAIYKNIKKDLRSRIEHSKKGTRQQAQEEMENEG